MKRFYCIISVVMFVFAALAEEKPIEPPVKSPHELGYTWQSCENKSLNYITIPFTQGGKFKPKCAPDVLYSWHDWKYVKKYAEMSAAGKSFIDSKNHPIFTFRTPTGSHGYGGVVMRIKLRDDVKFVLSNSYGGERSCSYYRKKFPKDYQKMVLVTYLSFLESYSEYVLCSEGAIHSWSYDTPEILSEIQDDKGWVKKNKYSIKKYDILWKYGNYGNDGVCVDDKYCSESLLDNKIKNLKEAIKNKKGNIFYLNGVSPDEAKHNSTKTPGYFNNKKDDVPWTEENDMRYSPKKEKQPPKAVGH